MNWDKLFECLKLMARHQSEWQTSYEDVAKKSGLGVDETVRLLFQMEVNGFVNLMAGDSGLTVVFKDKLKNVI